MKFKLKRICFSLLLILVLSYGLLGCSDRIETTEATDEIKNVPIEKPVETIAETTTPAIFNTLNETLEQYQPQVSILSPKSERVYQDNNIEVKLQVQDLPIFKDEELQMGPHLTILLDNQPYEAIYDLEKPIILKELSPGTHTIRVFASRPWNESFKNDGAYAQTTFHIFTKTDENNPDSSIPLLTYNRPNGDYGAEPIMLDYYLTNAPLHLVAQEDSEDDIVDWKIKVTINNQVFVLDEWRTIYLKGFKKGKNWVKLEFIDENGDKVKNAFNTTVRVITYNTDGQDTLSKLVRGEISSELAKAIVVENYQPQPIETTPLVEEEIPEIEEESPVVEDEAPVVEEEIPEIEEETPVVVEETPIVEDEAPVVEEEIPEIEEETPVVEENTPEIDQNNPEIEEENSSKIEEETLEIEEENPVIEEESSIMEEDNPTFEEESSIVEEEITVFEE